MPAVCLYFQIHQPCRLRPYSFFDIGASPYYEDEDRNCEAVLRAARDCYLPMNDILLELARWYGRKFRVAFSISGTALEQFEEFAPEVIESFQALAKTGCVEFLAETWAHSLAFHFSRREFNAQVKKHQEKIFSLFGQKAAVFRNTELIYHNDLALAVKDLGFNTILAEGADHVLGWRSPGYVYKAEGCPETALLLRNYALSDDLARRFSQQDWAGYPLTAEKYAEWLAQAEGDLVNLFMDYETFGCRHAKATGIFEFFRALPGVVLNRPGLSFVSPSQAAALPAVGSLDVPQYMSWADEERDLTSWMGNDMQMDAAEALYALEEPLLTSGREDLYNVWQRLQTSDHFHAMSTKWLSDTSQAAKTALNPYDAYIAFMNILADLAMRARPGAPVENLPDPFPATAQRALTQARADAGLEVMPVALAPVAKAKKEEKTEKPARRSKTASADKAVKPAKSVKKSQA